MIQLAVSPESHYCAFRVFQCSVVLLDRISCREKALLYALSPPPLLCGMDCRNANKHEHGAMRMVSRLYRGLSRMYLQISARCSTDVQSSPCLGHECNPRGQEFFFQYAYSSKSKTLEGNADYIAHSFSIASRKITIGNRSCREVAKKSRVIRLPFSVVALRSDDCQESVPVVCARSSKSSL